MKSPFRLVNIFLITLVSSILLGCGSKHQANVAKLDEVHGVCDNPARILSKRQYEICKMKERGNDGEPLEIDDLSTSLGDLISDELGLGKTIVGGSSFANRYLWQASLEVLSPFPIAVFLQLLSYYIAHELGTEIDKPRNLAKSVTVE